jgi:RNA polymerase sigma factor (sigma-70 family)
MMQDNELLRAYWRDRSEEAFAELVRRHIDLVFSTARRQVGDTALAEDVSQTVFCLLARKAGSLSDRPALAGWLYRATRFCAAKATRGEMRRRKRELEAVVMDSPDAKTNDVWERLAPMLDDALASLSEKDRLALLLRFFQRKPMRDVGEALGISEDAAKMRVARSIERLRGFFARRGVACTVAALAVLLADRSVEAAPANLARSLSKAALSATVGASGLSFLEIAALMTRFSFKKFVLGGSTAILCATVAWQAFNAVNRSKPEAATTQQNQRPSGTASTQLPTTDRIRSAGSRPPRDLTAAIANLRAALHSTNDSTVPGPKLVEAIFRFSPQRMDAFPILKEEAGAHDKTRLATDPDELAPRRAICAMGFLGKPAPEVTSWLWSLYDKEPDTRSDSVAYLAIGAVGQIGFQPEDIERLAVKVLARTAEPLPDLTDQDDTTNHVLSSDPDGNAFVKSQVAEWIATVIQNDPPAAVPFLPALESLLVNTNEDARFWAACALLQNEGAQNPGLASEISAGLKNGNQSRVSWASRILQKFGEAARPVVPALLEAANASTGNTREWAFLSVGKIRGELRAQNPEVDQALSKDEANQALLDKLNSNRYTARDLIGMLKDPGGAAVAAKLLSEKFPLATNALPALCDAVPLQQDDESREAVLNAIRKLDPTFALAPEDTQSIMMSLFNSQNTTAGKQALKRLLEDDHLLNLGWSTRPGFQSFVTNLAVQSPVAYNTFVTAVLEKAPAWRTLLPTPPAQ